ncbi:bifunctional oligoribonuclease/PAP phosphatase NrnA [Patescibacteria group bacterium]|nr:bifunctional oligoribonuclease/PAP phosphatase NrnA [Patescibacteria group bacterium]
MDALAERVSRSQRTLIISHIQPDGDAVGSVLGLYLGLTQLGRECQAVLADGVPEAFRFLTGSNTVSSTLAGHYEDGGNNTDIDLCIVVDAGDADRTGFPNQVRTWGRAGKLAVIDHHPKGDLAKLAAASYLDETASSTSELVYRLLSRLGVKFTPSLSTILLTGIYTDTGSFQHANTSPEVLYIASELMRRGARLQQISQEISRSKSIAGLKLLGVALERLRLTSQYRCAISLITHQDQRLCQADSQDMEGISSELSRLPGARFSLLLVEQADGTVRGSLRTSPGEKVRVSPLARLLSGGGHPRAAGFTLPGQLTQNKQGRWKVENSKKS